MEGLLDKLSSSQLMTHVEVLFRQADGLLMWHWVEYGIPKGAQVVRMVQNPQDEEGPVIHFEFGPEDILVYSLKFAGLGRNPLASSRASDSLPEECFLLAVYSMEESEVFFLNGPTMCPFNGSVYTRNLVERISNTLRDLWIEV